MIITSVSYYDHHICLLLWSSHLSRIMIITSVSYYDHHTCVLLWSSHLSLIMIITSVSYYDHHICLLLWSSHLCLIMIITRLLLWSSHLCLIMIITSVSYYDHHICVLLWSSHLCLIMIITPVSYYDHHTTSLIMIITPISYYYHHTYILLWSSHPSLICSSTLYTLNINLVHSWHDVAVVPLYCVPDSPVESMRSARQYVWCITDHRRPFVVRWRSTNISKNRQMITLKNTIDQSNVLALEGILCLESDMLPCVIRHSGYIHVGNLPLFWDTPYNQFYVSNLCRIICLPSPLPFGSACINIGYIYMHFNCNLYHKILFMILMIRSK